MTTKQSEGTIPEHIAKQYQGQMLMEIVRKLKPKQIRLMGFSTRMLAALEHIHEEICNNPEVSKALSDETQVEISTILEEITT